MSKSNNNTGPIYGVELLDSLPMDGGTMRQALPSRTDLEEVTYCPQVQGLRVVAGYEVLLEHYRRLLAVVAPLNSLRQEEGSSVQIVNDNPDFGGPACLINVCGEWTQYKKRSVYGESLADCLTKALEMKTAAEAAGRKP